MIGNLPESDEGDLDTQMAQAVLPPGSTATVIETAPIAGTWFIPWAAAFGLERRPDAVTMSYGLCEPSTGDFFLARPMRRLLDSALVRLGLVGTTAAASSGDDGSSDCVESAGGATPESVAPAVDYPGSSPYITSVGGSRIVLRRNNSRRTEVTWRDVDRTMVVNGETVAAPTSGGGGGVSVLYDQPWWQADAGIRHRGRTTPDIAMHASFGPGWPVFITGAGQRASASPAPGGFYAIAGTSASSPFFASNVAVFAAMQRRAGEPAFGHIAPALYDAALRSPKAVYDITRTSNDLYGVGCCEAKKGYDLASGFGAPNFDVFPWLLPPVGGR
jgi:kumamolisin